MRFRACGRSLAACALAAVVCLSACNQDTYKRLAANRVGEFHSRMNSNQLDAIYKDAHPDLRNSMGEEAFGRMLLNIRSRFGQVKHASMHSFTTGVFADGNVLIRITYETTFERGTIEELFLWRWQDQTLLLAGYHIRSISDRGDTRAR